MSLMNTFIIHSCMYMRTYVCLRFFKVVVASHYVYIYKYIYIHIYLESVLPLMKGEGERRTPCGFMEFFFGLSIL